MSYNRGSVHLCVAVMVAYVLIATMLCLTGQAAWPLKVQAVLMFMVGWAFVFRERMVHKKLTLVAAFVGVYAFIYSARAMYVAAYSDFGILKKTLTISPGWDDFSQAMALIGLAMVAFIGGALLHDRRVAILNQELVNGWKEHFRLRKEPSMVLLAVMIMIQIGMIAAMFPLAMRGYKTNLVEITTSAYLYLLPTVSHGVNLFIVTALGVSLVRWKTPLLAAVFVISLLLVMFNAYLLANLSTFRGFWTGGFLLIAVALPYGVRGRISPWFLVFLFLVYPYFKQVGVERGNSSMEIVNELKENPFFAYTSEGLKTAYGEGTDLNMYDTFVASMLWDHQFRPYVLTVAYTFVHWVPRQWWAGKPEGGNLCDTSYTNGAPYSPGIAGFYNDDGGLIYMVILMFFTGMFIRYLDGVVAKVQDQVLQACVYACLFFGTLVLTRSFLYQAFYGVLAFVLPLLLVYKICGLKTLRRSR